MSIFALNNTGIAIAVAAYLAAIGLALFLWRLPIGPPLRRLLFWNWELVGLVAWSMTGPNSSRGMIYYAVVDGVVYAWISLNVMIAVILISRKFIAAKRK